MGIKEYHTPLDTFNRKTGRFLVSRIFIKTRLTPNAITGLSFLSALLSALFFSMGHYLYLIFGVLLFELFQILDYSDGELARARNMASKHGEWLDRISDSVSESIILFGITFGIYRMLVIPTATIWIFGLLAIVGIQLRVFISYVNAFCFSSKARKKVRGELGIFYKILRVSWSIVSLSIFLFAVLNMMFIYLIIYATYNLLWFLASFVYFNFKYSKLYGTKSKK